MIKRCDRSNQRGAIIVLVSLCILAIGLVIGLAVETFRIMTSHLQMQNVAEYATEVVLAEIRSGSYTQTRTAQRVSAVSNENWMVSQAAAEIVDESDFCFNNLSCSMGFKVLVGCYDIGTNTLTCSLSGAPVCTGGLVQAAYVRVATFSKRRVALMMGKLFGVSQVNMSASAFTWLSGSLFMTGPDHTPINLTSCGAPSTDSSSPY